MKDKNLSAIKCILAPASTAASRLEREWRSNTHAVLEHDQAAFHLTLRALLKDKRTWPTVPSLRDSRNARWPHLWNWIVPNAAQHV